MKARLRRSASGPLAQAPPPPSRPADPRARRCRFVACTRLPASGGGPRTTMMRTMRTTRFSTTRHHLEDPAPSSKRLGSHRSAIVSKLRVPTQPVVNCSLRASAPTTLLLVCSAVAPTQDHHHHSPSTTTPTTSRHRHRLRHRHPVQVTASRPSSAILWRNG